MFGVWLRLGFAHHGWGVQFLHHDLVVLGDQAGGDLLRPVAAAAGDGRGDLGHGPARLLPPPRPLGLPAQPLLQRQVPGGVPAADPWCPVMLPARGHQRRAHPPVNPHRPTPGPPGQRGLRRRERDVPAARPVHRHPRHAQVRGQAAGPPEPHPPALGDLHLTPAAGEAPHPGVPDHKPLPTALTAVPRFARRILWPEKRGHRLVEIPQRLLLHR